MAFLGGLAGLLVALFGALCLFGWPIVAFLHYLIKLRRAWRRERQERRPRQPYDDAYERAVWDAAARNGRLAAERDLRELEP